MTLLVDTYDTEQGARRAVEVLRDLPPGRDVGVRLDSGDLAQLASLTRRILDDTGPARARIVASGGLDEYGIEYLLGRGAPIDVLAVGTKVATVADAPYLDTAYKLVDYAGRPVMKLSAGKVTLPGAKQVFRRDGCDDVLALHDEAPPSGSGPLLEPVMRAGSRVGPRLSPADTVVVARPRFQVDLGGLPAEMLSIRGPATLRPRTSARLTELTVRTRSQLEALTGKVVPAGRGSAG